MSEPRIGAPERYAGEPEGCNPSLTNCTIFFALQPLTIASEQAVVGFTINQLTGRARLWGTAEWDRQTSACTSFESFAAELRKVFGQGVHSTDAGGLLSLCQRGQSVFDFSIYFHTKARVSGWNESALRDAFLHGLADYIKDELVSYPLPLSLDEVIALAINIDLRIQARKREKQRTPPAHVSAHASRGSAPNLVGSTATPEPLTNSAEPMQLGPTSLSPEERERCLMSSLCLYCG